MENFELRENKNPLWTKEHLKNIYLNREAYGLNITENDIKIQEDKIENLSSDRRTSKESICYEIYSNDIYIGDIVLDLQGEIPEIDIMIFDEYTGKGYGKKAIKRFIDFEGRCFEEMECALRHKNPNLKKIKSIVKDLGFKYIYSSKDVEVYAFYREKD